MSEAQHSIKEHCQFVSHGCDRFRRPEFAAESAELCTEVTVTEPERGSRNAKRRSGPVHGPTGVSPQDSPATHCVVGTKSQPRGEVGFRWPAGHIDSHFADDCLRCHHVNAIYASKVHTRDSD